MQKDAWKAAGTPDILRDCVHSAHCRHNRLSRLGWLCRRSRPSRLYRPCWRSQESLPSRLCRLCWLRRLCRLWQLSRHTRLSRAPLGGGGGTPSACGRSRLPRGSGLVHPGRGLGLWRKSWGTQGRTLSIWQISEGDCIEVNPLREPP